MSQISCSHLFLSHCPVSTESFSLCLQGMVYSAEYIKKKLEQEMILSQAFGRDLVNDSVYRVKNGSIRILFLNLCSEFVLTSPQFFIHS